MLSGGRFITMSSTPSVPARPEPKRLHFLAPVLVGAMTGCIALPSVVFIHLLYPNLSGPYLILACVLAAVEAGYSHELLRTRRRFLEDIVRFRTIELALLFVVIKAGGYLGETWSVIVSDIKLWPQHPLTILDLDTIVVYALALLAWYSADATAGDLDRLGEAPVRSRHYVSPMDSLTNRFFWGGGLILALSGLALVGEVIMASPVRSMKALLQGMPSASTSGLAAAALVYFCLGLLMLGQVRITLYRMGWQQQGIPVDRVLLRRWTRGSLTLIALAAGLSFLLPTNYRAAAWLLQTLGTALAWLAAIMSYLAGLVIFVFISLLGLLAYLLSFGGASRPQPAAPGQFLPPVMPPVEGGVTPHWVLVVRSILFWGLLSAGLIYVIQAYLHEHPELTGWVVRVRPALGLRRLWQLVREWIARWRHGIQVLLPGRTARPPDVFKSGKSLWPHRLRGLSPRDRVFYYYWSVLRRAQRLGLARRPCETPYEYHASLGRHIAQMQQELGRLTDAFIIARYRGRPLDADEERRIRTDWQRVKGALRTLRKMREADEDSGSASVQR